MTEVVLSNLHRYERRVRNLWSFEPQRGQYMPSDDQSRAVLAEDAKRFGLDFWAIRHGDGLLSLPQDAGDFIYAARWFSILDLFIVAFPTADLRDAFVALNEQAEAVDDGAFWP